jgi:STE24 endopeptidase
VAVAELAVLLLAPGQPGPAAAAAAASDYLDPARIAFAVDYQTDLRLATLFGIGLEIAVLTLLAVALPRWPAVAAGRAARRPLLGAAAIGAIVSVTLALADLPLGLWVHERAVDVGLSVQSLGGWLFDRARSIAIGAAYAAIGALLLIFLQRRLPRAWWAAAAGIVVAFAVTVTYLAPVVIAPIFNDFEPIPEGAVREDVLELAERADVEVGDVYRVDASSRRTSLNAYISGLGSTRRVVLYDNLIDDAQRPALRSVVAHELSHVSRHDIPRGLLFVLLVAPAGMLFVREAGGAIARRAGSGPGQLAAIPAYALAITLATLSTTLVSNQLSRAVEERADRFAVELTREPDGLAQLQVQTAERNLSDPDPPGWWQFLFATHPAKVERLGIAEAYGADPPGAETGDSAAAAP